jgi:hypothetical protein
MGVVYTVENHYHGSRTHLSLVQALGPNVARECFRIIAEFFNTAKQIR